MSSVEITTLMVERAAKAAFEAECPRDWTTCRFVDKDHWRKFMRTGLEAALNQPSEPELEVTLAMINAGQLEMMGTRPDGWGEAARVAQAVYRAMRKMEPTPERRVPRQDSLFGKNVWTLDNGEFLHRRGRDGEREPLRSHRRKDDPR